LKIAFKISALVLVFISCKELSENKFDSSNIEEAKNILSEKPSYPQTILEFSESLCDCIETKESTDNFSALTSRYDFCAKQYISKHTEEIVELVSLLDSKLEENHTEYENGKIAGSIIAKEGNVILARDCMFFQTEFEKIKYEIVKSIDANSNNYKSKIQTLKNKISESKSQSEIQQIISIIGVTFELNEQYVQARHAYEKGAEIDSKQNINKILLELLKVKLK